MTEREDAATEVARPRSLLAAVVETILLAASVPVLGRWLNPADPFFVRGPVSWPLLVPMLAGLRYGFLAGFGCASSLSFAVYACWRHPVLAVPASPGPLVIGLLLAGMLAGEFTEIESALVRRMAALREYERQRFNEFARSYQLLKVSHDIVEERSAAAAGNVRNALASLRAELLRAPAATWTTRGPLILEAFQAFGQVQSAAVLPVERDQVQPAAAVLGRMPSGTADDPLLAEALRTRHVVSVAQEGRGGEALVAAVPLVDVEGKLWAVVAVAEMPFFALTTESLRLLALMGGAIADALAFGVSADDANGGLAPFRRQVERCARDAREHHIPATMLVLSVGHGDSRVVAPILAQRRALDQARVVAAQDGGQRLFILLPLTEPRGVDGYLARVHRVLRDQARGSLVEASVDQLYVADLSLPDHPALEELRVLGERPDRRFLA